MTGESEAGIRGRDKWLQPTDTVGCHHLFDTCFWHTGPHIGATVYPKKYAHGFCCAVLCCGFSLTDFPISIRLTLLALWQSNDCPSASKATLMNMDKYFMWIHYERLHNHKKAKHNKTVCIFLGIYCMAHFQKSNCDSYYRHLQIWINTLRLRRDGCHFADDTCKFSNVFYNEKGWISNKIALKFVPRGPIYQIPASVQIMAWPPDQATRHYLNLWWIVYWRI